MKEETMAADSFVCADTGRDLSPSKVPLSAEITETIMHCTGENAPEPDIKGEEDRSKSSPPPPAENGIERHKNKKRTGDESCFKTPALPSSSKKPRSGPVKRRQKASADPAADKCVENGPIAANGNTSQGQVFYSEEELIRKFVGIGKHSFLCPRSQLFLAKRYSGMALKRPLGADGAVEDMVNEVVIDEFSLLLFRTADDFNLLKEREEKIRDEEEAMVKQRRHEENVRLGKAKKKGRKSKAELKREKKEAKRKVRKEQKRREKEERRQRRQSQSGSSSQQQEDQPERRRERKEAKLERERKREERRSIKQTNNKRTTTAEEKQKEKRTLKAAGPACSSSSSDSTPPITAAIQIAASQQQQLYTENGGKVQLTAGNTQSPLAESDSGLNSVGPSRIPSATTPSAAVKRPSSAAIGIATSHRNGLVGSLADVPSARKLPRLEGDRLDELGMSPNRGLLIGIAVSSASCTQPTATCPPDSLAHNQQQDSLIKAAQEKDLLQRVSANISSLAASGSNSQNITCTSQHQDQLQQAFLKNPELAINLHQSLAALYSLDPSLAAKAGASLSAGPTSLSASQSSATNSSAANKLQPSLLSNSEQLLRMETAAIPLGSAAAGLLSLPSFPLGVPLASQLASLAAVPPAAGSSRPSQSVPFKSGRWCNMRFSIAQQIAKNQQQRETMKKAGTGGRVSAASGSRQQGEPSRTHNQQQAERRGSSASSVAQQQRMSSCNTNSNPACSTSASFTTSQLLQLQQQEQQMRRASQAQQQASSSSSSSLQQQLDQLVAQQQRLQAIGCGGQQNDFLSSVHSGLLGRLSQQKQQPASQLLCMDGLLSGGQLGVGLGQQFLPMGQPQSASMRQQLFGGFPIQPLGLGTGSLTSGNSDAAAAAQLQHQGQLLAAIQGQQFPRQQSHPQNVQLNLAASLLAQLGAGPSALTGAASSALAPANNLVAFTNHHTAGFPPQQPCSTSLANFSAGLSANSNINNSLLHNDSAESILAAFLSGQPIEPKVPFPPLPSASTSTACQLIGSALNIEQLMRAQAQLAPKLTPSSTILPPPSSLISGSFAAGAAPPMNPIEQELLMRQIRLSQQLPNGTMNSAGLPTSKLGGGDNAPRT